MPHKVQRQNTPFLEQYRKKHKIFSQFNYWSEHTYLKKTITNQENELCSISERLVIFTVEWQVLRLHEITSNAAETKFIIYEQLKQFNILNPTGHVMHQQFNIQQL